MKQQKDTGMTFLSIKDAQTILKVSRSTIYRLRKTKKLKGKKIGSSVRFSAEDIKKAMK